MVLPSVHSCDLRESQEVQSFRCRATGDLVVVVLQYSRLLEPSLSRDQLSANLVPLILRLVHGVEPRGLIVDLIDLIHLVDRWMRRHWLAYSMEVATRR